MDEAMKQKINAVADRLALLCEDEPVIALAGAHAKGMADAASDLDMFVYCKRPKPYPERKRLIEEFCDGPDAYFVTEGFDYP